MAAAFALLAIALIIGGLPLLWWLWWRVDTRLRTSEGAGVGAWVPFLLVVALCMLIGAVGTSVFVFFLPAIAGVFVLATPALAIVTIRMFLGHRHRSFARLLVLQAAVAFLVAAGALIFFLYALSRADL